MSPAARSQSAGVIRLRRLFLIVGVLLVIGVIVGISRLDVSGTIDELTLPLRHDDIIRQQAAEKGVPADLIAAVIYEESKFQDQTSSAGARGLMQITPDTADTIENLSGGETFVYEDLADPELNIRYGTFYLAYLLDKYGGDVVAALAAYNAGEGNADAWGGAGMKIDDIEFPETYDYVRDVLERRQQYREKYADELGL
ncbi:MAG: lytic transglycosylase domain-containing protein [Solirubrobacterales bacterium]